jgi:dephospho-CoA kinase
MNKPEKKFIIGLTGNVATGKSVVRLMLEHLGAYSIDADKLTHKLYTKKAPAYSPVVKHFGQWILDSNGEINRKKLGQIVFTDPQALQALEEIVHPFINQAIEYLINKTDKKVIVIEAIKIVNGPIEKLCNSIWVTSATRENQFSRLIKNRQFSPSDAQSRIESQEPAIFKLQKADHIIDTNGSIEKTWQQVQAGWDKYIGEDLSNIQPIEDVSSYQPINTQNITLHRAKPTHAKEIAQFINQQNNNQELTATDIMISFGEKAYFLIKEKDEIIGLAGWQVENLVVKIDTILFSNKAYREIGLRKIFTEIESSAEDLNAEVAIAMIPKTDHDTESSISELSYEDVKIEEIKIKAWRDIINSKEINNHNFWLKALRKDRILRPF